MERKFRTKKICRSKTEKTLQCARKQYLKFHSDGHIHVFYNNLGTMYVGSLIMMFCPHNMYYAYKAKKSDKFNK